MEIKRNKDGTIKGISTMGDNVKKDIVEKKELKKDLLKKEYEKKWGKF